MLKIKPLYFYIMASILGVILLLFVERTPVLPLREIGENDQEFLNLLVDTYYTEHEGLKLSWKKEDVDYYRYRIQKHDGEWIEGALTIVQYGASAPAADAAFLARQSENDKVQVSFAGFALAKEWLEIIPASIIKEDFKFRYRYRDAY